LKDEHLDFSIYEKNKFILYAMIGLKSKNDDEEKETILTALDHNHNIESYIFDNMETL
jgi:hypothetical protein